MRTFKTGATRDDSDHKLDFEGFLHPAVLVEFGQYMHKHRHIDGGLRDSDNWQKGMPIKQYLKSLIRHVLQMWLILRGWVDLEEPDPEAELIEAACATIFNAQGIIFEILMERGNTDASYSRAVQKEMKVGNITDKTELLRG